VKIYSSGSEIVIAFYNFLSSKLATFAAVLAEGWCITIYILFI